MQKINDLKTIIESMADDAEKFYTKGVASAGARLRKSLQEIKKVAQDARVEIQEMKSKKKED